MIGSYKVIVRNKRCRYEFELRRNITVLQGDSGTGKTKLYEMISDHYRYGKQSGVAITCQKTIVPLNDSDWQEKTSEINDSIFVVDEDSEFIRTAEFARAVKGADNYFLLITRQYLHQLPYSVDEIFELTGNKTHRFRNIYEAAAYMYDRPQTSALPFEPDHEPENEGLFS